MGIGLGLAIAFIHILWENFKTPYHTELEGADQGKPVTMVLSEQVTFLNKASIIHTLMNFLMEYCSSLMQIKLK